MRAVSAVAAFCLLLPLSSARADDPPAALEGWACGGHAAIRCAQGLWCDPEPGACGRPDAAGTCIRAPRICTREYRPVCGCDGKTYGNDCDRRASRAPKRLDGAC